MICAERWQMRDKHRLSNPEPNPLNDVSRLPLRPYEIRSIHRSFPGLDIRVRRVHPLRSLEYLPEGVQDEIDRNADIGSDEVVDSPRAEDIKAVKDNDYGKEYEREPGSVWLEG